MIIINCIFVRFSTTFNPGFKGKSQLQKIRKLQLIKVEQVIWLFLSPDLPKTRSWSLRTETYDLSVKRDDELKVYDLSGCTT